MKTFTMILLAIFTGIGLSAQQEQVEDGGFETGTSGTVWTQSSTNFGTPLCDAGCGNCGGDCIPNTGSWYAWFGGANSTEIGVVEQSVDIPSASSAELSFYLKIPSASANANDSFKVMINGNTIWGVSSLDSANYPDYVRESIDMSAYLDQTITLRFEGIQSTADITNYLLDDVSLTTTNAAGVHTNLLGANQVVAYPVPATDQLFIKFDLMKAQEVKIEMFAVNGKTVYLDNINNVLAGVKTLNISNLAAGIYIMKIHTDEGVNLQKVVID